MDLTPTFRFGSKYSKSDFLYIRTCDRYQYLMHVTYPYPTLEKKQLQALLHINDFQQLEFFFDRGSSIYSCLFKLMWIEPPKCKCRSVWYFQPHLQMPLFLEATLRAAASKNRFLEVARSRAASKNES